jgi:hypothetical protein
MIMPKKQFKELLVPQTPDKVRNNIIETTRNNNEDRYYQYCEGYISDVQFLHQLLNNATSALMLLDAYEADLMCKRDLE